MILKKPAFKSQTIAENDLRVSDHIPVVAHLDEHILLTKDNDLILTLQLEGLCFDTKSDIELMRYKDLCSQLYQSISTGKIAIYFHMIRKIDNPDISGKFPDGFSKVLDKSYYAGFNKHTHFTWVFYMSLVYRGVPKVGQGFANFISKLRNKSSSLLSEYYFNQGKQELYDVAQRFINTLSVYKPRKLGFISENGKTFSEPLTFINFLVNAEDHLVPLMRTDYASYLPRRRLYFSTRSMKWQGGEKDTYGAILGIKEYCSSTMPGHLDALSMLKCPLIITQTFIPTVKTQLHEGMNRHHAQLSSADDPALTQLDEIAIAQDMLASGNVNFGQHSFSLLCLADNPQQLEKMISEAEAVLIEANITPIREDLNLEPAFFGQIPGNMAYLGRIAPIHTLNIASFNAFHSSFKGNPQGSLWGPPVSILRSKTGSNVYVNWHVGKVGNTLIIGDTGSGKSLAANFLLSQSMKFWHKGLRIFFFDYKRGNEAFIRALGGHYIRVGQLESRLNPLQIQDTHLTRIDLQIWLEMLLKASNISLDHALIKEAIDTNYANKIQHRILEELEQSLVTKENATPLSSWYGEGRLAHYFGDHDTLSFENRIQGMDMTDVLEDEQALPVVLWSLFMRINYITRTHPGEPFIIVLDEGWALLRSKMFRDRLESWLLTIRRAGGLVVFLTQNIDHLKRYPELSHTIINNTVTKIFFPQYEADKNLYCELCKLTAYEYELIRMVPKESHYFLFKQKQNSTLATIPLEGAKEYIPLLSGTDESVHILDEIRAEHGDDPNVWLPIFIKRMNI
jgi:type IV secretion system protein VirB4